MMTFKNIFRELQNRKIDYEVSENGQNIRIFACYFSEDNFFDYGEDPKEPKCTVDDTFLQELFEDPRIDIITCENCCGCAGW